MKTFLIPRVSWRDTTNVLRILLMKLRDSDLIQEYNATRRLGNPDTAAAGDAKQLRETMHETNLTFEDLNEKKMYEELVNNLSDSLVSVEGLLPVNKVIQAFKEVIQDQIKYHEKHLDYYEILDGAFK
jgi:hypothetical protein